MFLAAAFTVIAVLPLATLALPSVRIEIPSDIALLAAFPSGAGAVTATNQRPRNSNSGHEATAVASLSHVVRAAWAMGALYFALPVVLALFQARRLRQDGLPWLDARALVLRLAVNAGINRSIDVRLHQDIRGPATCGFVRATVAMPLDAQEWDER